MVNKAGMNEEGLNEAGMNEAGMNDSGMNEEGLNDSGKDWAVMSDGIVSLDPAEFLRELARERLLAIIRGNDPEVAVQAALALTGSGIRFLEVSLVTADALSVIAEVVRRAPSGSVIGAGTVLSRDDVDRAQQAGARFMVTPALTESVAESVSRGIPVLAGAFTPTEVVAAMRTGATAVKLFPSGMGGPAYLRALRDPLPGIPLVPVGGVDAALAAEYLASGAVAVGVGSPLVGDAVRGGDLGALRRRAAELLAVASAPRPSR